MWQICVFQHSFLLVKKAASDLAVSLSFGEIHSFWFCACIWLEGSTALGRTETMKKTAFKPSA